MITGQTTSNTYQGDGSNRVWNILFEFTDSSQIKLRVNGKGITTNYSIDIVDKTVTYPTVESELEPLNSSQEITIYRETPITQDIDFINGGPLNAEMIEDGLDKLTQILQEGTNMNIEGFKIVPEVDENSTNEEVVGAKAIYELVNDTQTSTSELKNKTIDADENTIKDLTTSNFKSGVIQTSVRDSETATDTNLVTEKAVRTELDTKQDTLTFDEEPTENSDNPVKSGGVYNALSSLKGPYLFDIKINSEPLAQKGWSCISYPTQNKLVKYAVPTAYNFLKDKLDNVDANIEGWQSKNFSGIRSFIVDNNLLIFNRSDNSLYKCEIGNIGDSSTWTQINLSSRVSIDPNNEDNYKMLITDKIVCFYLSDYNTNYNLLIILNRQTLEEVKIINNSTGSSPQYISLVKDYVYYTINNNTYRFLNTTVANDINPELLVSGQDIRLVFRYNNGYYYFVKREGGYPRLWWVYKATDLNGTWTAIGN